MRLHDASEVCALPGCKRLGAYVYMGRNVCEEHFTRHCQKRLNLKELLHIRQTAKQAAAIEPLPAELTDPALTDPLPPLPVFDLPTRKRAPHAKIVRKKFVGTPKKK